jgi:uncharacterized protein
VWCRIVDAAALLTVHVVPGASRSRVVGEHGDAIKVAVAARAIDGQANRALLAFWADLLDVRPAQLSLVAGHGSRRKVIRIDSATATEAHALVDRIAQHLRVAVRQADA